MDSETCRTPYDCGDLTDSSTVLMVCSSKSPSASFFGQKALLNFGAFGARDQSKFFEFLQTVTDAPVLRRGNETFETKT